MLAKDEVDEAGLPHAVQRNDPGLACVARACWGLWTAEPSEQVRRRTWPVRLETSSRHLRRFLKGARG